MRKRKKPPTLQGGKQATSLHTYPTLRAFPSVAERDRGKDGEISGESFPHRRSRLCVEPVSCSASGQFDQSEALEHAFVTKVAV